MVTIIGVAAKNQHTGEVIHALGFDDGHPALFAKAGGNTYHYPWENGFWTDREEFVSRQEGLALAKAAYQIEQCVRGYDGFGLCSEHLSNPEDIG